MTPTASSRVSARDKATGKEQAIQVQSSGGLAKEEVERLVAEAESHAAEDAAWRELAEVKNAAEAAAHAARSMLAEHEEKIPEADRAELEAAAKALEEASQGEDKQAIQERLNELQQVSMRIGAAIHQAAQGEGGDGQEAQGGRRGGRRAGKRELQRGRLLRGR